MVNTFGHKGKTFIVINGKEFYLLQGYREQVKRYRSGGFIFIQVAGRSPLHYEDLPEKNWEIVRTKTPQGVIYTAYDAAYFDWETAPEERSEAKKAMLFVGRDRPGALFLGLYVCARLLRIAVSEDDLQAAVKRALEGDRTYPFLEIEDEGNEKNTAFSLKGIGKGYEELAEEDFKSLIEKPKTTNGRRKKK